MSEPLALDAITALIERLREATTVLDEPFHQNAIGATLIAAADALAALSAQRELAEARIAELCVAHEELVANQAEAFERLSSALTGGNAGTWEEVSHAAETLSAQLRDAESTIEDARTRKLWTDAYARGDRLTDRETLLQQVRAIVVAHAIPCSACLYWVPPSPGKSHGLCGVVRHTGDESARPKTARIEVDYEVGGYSGRLLTMPDFGCVQWERKP